MVDHINASQSCHIVTIEDPIEVLHADRVAVVSQREIGADTPDVAEAIRRAARQGADVLLVSELPDTASIREALEAAASGRLVLAVVNSLSAIDTVSWMTERFEPHLQGPMRTLLARVLRGIVCQRLVDRADGRGRVAMVESLVGTAKVREAIAQHALPDQIQRLMFEGEYHGMATFDQALYQLFSDEYVTLDEAMTRASDPEDFRIAVQQAGFGALR
jgi:twitching motility protein PilT